MEKAGVLIVVVQKASLTRDTELLGKMDPYALLKINNNEYRTKVKEDAGKTPSWNETFEFSAKSGDVLDFGVYDKDDVGVDDFIGGAQLVLHTDSLKERQSSWFPIFFGEKKEKTGQILLELVFVHKDEKNVLVNMFEGRQKELVKLQNVEKSLQGEVDELKQRNRVLTAETENLKMKWQEEKALLIKSFEGQNEGNKNHEIELINELTNLRQSVQNLQAERAFLVKSAEANQQKIQILSSDVATLKRAARAKIETTKPEATWGGAMVTLVIYTLYVLGSRS